MLGNRLYDDDICDMSGKIKRRRQIKMDRFDQYSYYTLLARARACLCVCLSVLFASKQRRALHCLSSFTKKGEREKRGDGGTRAQSKQQSTFHFEEREEGSVE